MKKKKLYGLVQEFTNRSAATMDGLNAFSLQSKMPVTYVNLLMPTGFLQQQV
jgi:hypothetical protein